MTNLEFDSVSTSTAMLTGKGANLIRFSVDDTVVSFINCHLAYGKKNIKDRIMNLESIHSEAF